MQADRVKPQSRLVVWLDDERAQDVARVGGKNSSLAEMIMNLSEAGVAVPEGFATTSEAYWEYLSHNKLDENIAVKIKAYQRGKATLAETGRAVRAMFLKAEMPPALAESILAAYHWLGESLGRENVDVAARSSATAEDLPEASFAGQQESFLNVHGDDALLDACRRCYASLFTDRAISYRENQGFDHLKVALSIGVQRMVRSDKAGSGVMFSVDTETGFPDVVLITAAWGLGETIVQGTVDPDEYMVYKPLLDKGAYEPIVEKALGFKGQKLIYASRGKSPTRLVKTTLKERAQYVLRDEQILQLSRWAVIIEQHYGRAMDMEWAEDGETGELFIVQARPETVQSRKEAGSLRSYSIRRKGKKLVSGLSIGDAVASGEVIRLLDPREIERFKPGAILVTDMTDPDWVPIMKKAAALITDRGGRTSHAAIVSRELGLPAIVGTDKATSILKDGQIVTVSCAEGDRGFVYEGVADYEATELSLDEVPDTRTPVMLMVANPAAAHRWWRLPADGVGLARMEFVINNHIRIHPLALLHPEKVTDREARREIKRMTLAYEDKPAYYIDTLARGLGRIAATQYPRPVVVRLSDFKSNEYADLIGGSVFEPDEENPMLGWRGAARYYSEEFREAFALECRALKQVRERFGLDNVIVMVPFCRTLEEADKVLAAMAEYGLKRGENGLKVYVMAEIPSNVILAEEFAERFDGFSIGSNDLTQLTLGVARDSERLKDLFDEDNEAVRRMIADLISRGKKAGVSVGLCGQAPSDHPEFAKFLVESGIDSISVMPDSFLRVKQMVAEAEAEAKAGAGRKAPRKADAA
jgi:pyruvate,water dikinase